jgi:uncharacterized protein involved in tolerance to divalent cations
MQAYNESKTYAITKRSSFKTLKTRARTCEIHAYAKPKNVQIQVHTTQIT